MMSVGKEICNVETCERSLCMQSKSCHYADAEQPHRRTGAKPVTTVEELQTLDEAAMVRGYRAGLGNAADFTERERGYWHGYLNGLVDGGHAKASAEQAELARASANRARAGLGAP